MRAVSEKFSNSAGTVDMMRNALLSLLALSVSAQGKEAGPVVMYCTHPVILGHLVMQYIGSASGDASGGEGVAEGAG